MVNPQQRGDHEGSGQTTHTNRSQSRGKSHVSDAKNERDMQREIDELKKKLRRARRRRSSLGSESSSEDAEDATYRQRSRTPPSETFSGKEEYSSHRRKDKALMCKIFPFSLGPMAMRWFNGLKANSIDSFKKLTQSFGAHFITCSRVPLPLGSLLSMSKREKL